MDAELRKSIISRFTSSPVKEAVEEPVKDTKEDNTDWVYKFRNQLKKVKEYSKLIKVDDEDWTEENWKGFSTYIAKKPVNTTQDVLASVMENKQKRFDEEQEAKSLLRKKILQSIKL